MDINNNDELLITQETVDWFKGTRWENFFAQKHIGETVLYGGEDRTYSEQGTSHQLAFQEVRGFWMTPNCSLEIIERMRVAYLSQHADA